MDFFTKLSDHNAEQISGGKDKWSDIAGQPIPPGLYNNFIESGSLPKGLASSISPCGCTVTPIHGKKKGFDAADNLGIVIIPPGLAV